MTEGRRRRTAVGRRMTENGRRTTDDRRLTAAAGEDTEICSHKEGNTPGEPRPVAFRSRSSGGRLSGLAGKLSSHRLLLGFATLFWRRLRYLYLSAWDCASTVDLVRTTTAILCLSAALGLSQGAYSAVVTTYTDAAAFQATLEAGSYLEDFSSLEPTAFGNSLSFTGGGFAFDVASSEPLWGEGSSAATMILTASSSYHTLTLSFSGGGTTAVGGNFFPDPIFGNSPGVSISLSLNDGTGYSFTSTTGTDWPFVGFTSSTPITSLTFAIKNTGDVVAIDNIVVGHSAIPEPSTYAVFFGLCALGLVAWRRRLKR